MVKPLIFLSQSNLSYISAVSIASLLFFVYRFTDSPILEDGIVGATNDGDDTSRDSAYRTMLPPSAKAFHNNTGITT